MSVEYFQQLLGQANTSQDQVLQQSAAIANQYTEAFKAGQFSKEEYQQLMSDIATSAQINQSANDVANLETLNTAINGLIRLASLAG